MKFGRIYAETFQLDVRKSRNHDPLSPAMCWMKRLEQGGFHIPQSADGRIELTSRELAAILSGIKPQRYYKRYSKKS